MTLILKFDLDVVKMYRYAKNDVPLSHKVDTRTDTQRKDENFNIQDLRLGGTYYFNMIFIT